MMLIKLLMGGAYEKPGASDQLTPPINPPLGWVLSEATQQKFESILKYCGNEDELNTLVRALGKTD